MSTVTVSPKFQVVIPKALRQELGLKPGAKLEVSSSDGRIEMTPSRPLASLRGSLKGPNRFEREKDRVL